jgi:phage FluMu gp28-like protein
MTELAQFLAIAAFVALALAFALFVRRAGRFVSETRELETFRRTAADLTARVDTSLDGVAQRIDGVRRKTLAAEAITENIVAATDAVERYTIEARALPGPEGAAEIRDALIGELERAGRALQMVEHGCAILNSAKVGGREIEAQTAIKRGYLNVLHAREAIRRYATRAAAVGIAGQRQPRLFERRNA